MQSGGRAARIDRRLPREVHAAAEATCVLGGHPRRGRAGRAYGLAHRALDAGLSTLGAHHHLSWPERCSQCDQYQNIYLQKYTTQHAGDVNVFVEQKKQDVDFGFGTGQWADFGEFIKRFGSVACVLNIIYYAL